MASMLHNEPGSPVERAVAIMNGPHHGFGDYVQVVSREIPARRPENLQGRTLHSPRSGEIYTLARELGQDKFKVVHKALQVKSDKYVTVSVLHGVASDEMKRDLPVFEGLEHENIVQLLEWFESDIGMVMVYEFLAGATLEVQRKDYLSSCRAFPVPYALKRFRALLKGLDYMESQHVVHADIKSDNIVVTQDGVTKINNFGLSRVVPAGRLFVTENSFFTPFIDPEALVFSDDGKVSEYRVSHASDIYSAGLVLVEMLTGFAITSRRPDADWMDLKRQGAVPPLVDYLYQTTEKSKDSKVSLLVAIVKHCLKKDQSNRLSASELLDILEEKFPESDDAKNDAKDDNEVDNKDPAPEAPNNHDARSVSDNAEADLPEQTFTRLQHRAGPGDWQRAFVVCEALESVPSSLSLSFRWRRIEASPDKDTHLCVRLVSKLGQSKADYFFKDTWGWLAQAPSELIRVFQEIGHEYRVVSEASPGDRYEVWHIVGSGSLEIEGFTFHMKFGDPDTYELPVYQPRPPGEPVLVERWENQRFIPIFNWGTNLSPTLDHPPWSLADGTRTESKEDYKLERYHEWVEDDWSVGQQTCGTDKDGFAYAVDFDLTNRLGGFGRGWTHSNGAERFVRKRKWFRHKRFNMGLPPADPDLGHSDSTAILIEAERRQREAAQEQERRAQEERERQRQQEEKEVEDYIWIAAEAMAAADIVALSAQERRIQEEQVKLATLVRQQQEELLQRLQRQPSPHQQGHQDVSVFMQGVPVRNST